MLGLALLPQTSVIGAGTNRCCCWQMQLLCFGHTSRAQSYESRLQNSCCIAHFVTDAFLCSSTMLQALRLNRPGTAAFCPPVPGIPDSLPGQIEDSDTIMHLQVCNNCLCWSAGAWPALLLFYHPPNIFLLLFYHLPNMCLLIDFLFRLSQSSQTYKNLRRRWWVMPIDQTAAIQYMFAFMQI